MSLAKSMLVRAFFTLLLILQIFIGFYSEVIRDIIKNCSFETKKPDDIIIHQGDIGDW